MFWAGSLNQSVMPLPLHLPPPVLTFKHEHLTEIVADRKPAHYRLNLQTISTRADMVSQISFKDRSVW